MKHVLSNNELPHKWAHQLQEEGRNGKNSFHFNGAGIYSYGTEIARIIKRHDKTAYIRNTTGYSITTTAHQAHVSSAIPENAITFYIGDLARRCSLRDVNGTTLFDYAIHKAAEALTSSQRVRKSKYSEQRKTWFMEDHAKWLERAKQVSSFFGLRRKVDDGAIVRLKDRIEAERKRQLKAELERQQKLERENAERLSEWLHGKRDYVPYGIERVYLRVVEQKNRAIGCGEFTNPVLETSKGVMVPLADAERAFRFAIARREKGWRRNGEQFQVGEYQLDAISEGGIVAGCHRIHWDEINRIAKQQGWCE